MKEVNNINHEVSAIDMLDLQYSNTDDNTKQKIDYWTPLNSIIFESIELRDTKGLSQEDLALAMKTKQSVISRFENMGRLPSYDFIARLSLTLGHKPGMTLYGDYMAVVPLEKQALIKNLAEKENVSTEKYVQNLLDNCLRISPFAQIEPPFTIVTTSSGTSVDFEYIFINQNNEKTSFSQTDSVTDYTDKILKPKFALAS